VSEAAPRELYGFAVGDDGDLLVIRETVHEEWLDHNGHMNVAAYLIAFDSAVRTLCTGLGIGPDQIPLSGRTIFVGQANIVYRHELVRGSRIRITARILAVTDGRAHACLSMFDEDRDVLAAFNEQLFVCADMATRRPCPFPPVPNERFRAVFETQRGFALPKYVGRRIRLDPDPARHEGDAP
jgi:acyl-CoA thioester hydrolase